MAGTIILDKSSFQSFGWREHRVLATLLVLGLPVTLAKEILSDLAKAGANGGPDKVQQLARKFYGRLPTVLVSYREACAASLLGQEPPKTGQLIPSGGRRAQLKNGSMGLIVGPDPVNHAVERWSRGEFFEAEEDLARALRSHAQSLSHNRFRSTLRRHKVTFQKVATAADARVQASSELASGAHQLVLLEWLLDSLRFETALRNRIVSRWNSQRPASLLHFAPYASFCVFVMIVYDLLTRSSLLGEKPTNLIDLDYLYYLPFTKVFLSDDKLHKIIAPIVAPKHVMFCEGRLIKKDLSAIADIAFGDAEDPPHIFNLHPHLHQFALDNPEARFCELWKFASGNDPLEPPRPPLKKTPEQEALIAEMLEVVRKTS